MTCEYIHMNEVQVCPELWAWFRLPEGGQRRLQREKEKRRVCTSVGITCRRKMKTQKEFYLQKCKQDCALSATLAFPVQDSLKH